MEPLCKLGKECTRYIITTDILIVTCMDTKLIPDNNVFAVMSRVNKVIVGTHAVMANQALLSQSGVQIIATAAVHHSVPVIVCSGLYKVAPLYPYDVDSDNLHVGPDAIMLYENGNDRIIALSLRAKLCYRDH